MSKPIRVFLSYASEDRDKVEQLYGLLLKEGYKPWMDKRDILSGENWELSIYRGIRRADFFLACISPRALGKRGFLQKEIKKALSYWEEKLDDDIYIIPILLEPCEIPEPLNQFEGVNLFEPNGFSRLRHGIEVGISKIRQDKERLAAALAGLVMQQLEYQDVRRENPKYDINVQYPHFDGPSELGLDDINLHLEALVRYEAMLCRSVIYSSPVKIMDKLVWPACWIDGESQVTLVNNEIISIMIDFASFRSPAAHGNKWRTGLNYGINPATFLHFDDLFDSNINYWEELSPIVFHEFSDFSWAITGDLNVFDTVAAYSGPGSFNLTPDAIIFSYNGPSVIGVVKATIPYARIRHLFNPAGPLKKFRE